MITISDGTKSFEINSGDQAVAETDCLDFYEWIVNAVQAKLRKVQNRLILEHTNLNPSKLSDPEKKNALKDVPLKSIREKNAEFEATLGGV